MKYKTLRFTLVSLLMMLCGTMFAAWQKTTSLAIGDIVVMAAEKGTATQELTAVTTTGTTIGTATAYTDTPAGTYPLTVVAGNQEGSIAFKTKDNTFLSWSSGNSLTTTESVTDASSWTVEFNDALATVINVGTPARILQYNANNPRFACYGNSNQTKLTFWKQVAGSAIAMPAITPNGGSFLGTQTVTLSCETEGASIYYTLDGSDPTAESTLYTSAIELTATTTVKAIAIKESAASAVASATFTAIPSYSTIAELTALENNALFAFTGEPLIVAKPTAKHVFIQDESGSSLIYDISGELTEAAVVGKTIAANWTGKVSIYKNLFELVPDDAIVVNDDPVQPVNYPAIALGTAVMNQVFTLKDITSYSVDGKNITIKANGDDKDISEAQGVYGYNQFGIEIPECEEGKTYQMVGAIGQYNDKVQFWPIEITEQVEETPDALAEAKTALQTAIAIASNINPEGLADAITAAQAALTADGATVESIAQAAQTLEAAIKTYFDEVLPRLGAIVQGLNDSTLNAAYTNAQTVLATEGVTPQELAVAMQQIIATAQDVAPDHLQNLKGYAVKYGAENAVALVDSALAAIEAGNVSQIIATMAAVKETATPLAKQVLSGIIGYVQQFGLTEQAAQAQTALESDNYVTMITTAKALFTHLVAAANDYLPKLGAIAEGLNDSTLNTAYADAQTLLAKESITPEELGAAMQNIIVAAKAVAPEHLQNLKGYAVKYGAEEAAALVDSALVAIEAGNVSQIIATMTAVKKAATPLAQQVLSGITGYVQQFGLTEQAAQAQAALESGNYITMITVAKALYTHLIAAAKNYLPKLGAIAEGLNDSTLNAAYANAQTVLANENVTPEDLGTAMQQIIVAAKAVAPAHLQNLRGYAVKYGQEGTAAIVDSALVAIEAGNVSKIIATMTAVREEATPLATGILTQMIGYAESYPGFTDDVTEANAALEGGNYITMITTTKALYTKLIAAANDYVTSAKAIPTEGKKGVEDLNTAIEAAEQALAAQDSDFSAINTAISNLVAAVKAFEEANTVDSDLVEIAQDQGKTLDDFARTELVVGDDYNTYTCTEGIQVAFKMFDIDVQGCDYVVVKFAEPVAAGWELAFWAKNDNSTVPVPAGATEYKYVFADDAKCAIVDDVLPQICMLHLWTGTTPLVAKVKGVYKHKASVPTGIDAINTAIQNGNVFNMNGQKVNKAQKGLYIINGKKVLVK